MKKSFCLLAALLLGLTVRADAVRYTPVMELNCNAGDFAQLKDISPNHSKVTVHYPEKLGWCDGPDGKALEFVAEYADTRTPRGCIEIEPPENFDPSKGFTAIVQFKTPKSYNYKRRYQFLHLAQGTDNITGFTIYLLWRTFQCRFGTKSKTEAKSDPSKVVFQADTWYDGAIVFDGKTMSVYVNKKLHGAPIPATVPKVDKRFKLMVGATHPKGAGYGSTGAISVVKLYQEAFTAEEIANLQ